jgi:hypothetical protein
MGLALSSLQRRSEKRRQYDRGVFRAVSQRLERGETLDPRPADPPPS